MWQGAARYPDPSVQALDKSFEKYCQRLAAVELLFTGCRWAEGPVWFGDARCLLWSDIPNNRILRWDEETGATTAYRKPSNFANGNTRDRQGRLLTCEHGTRRVTRTEYDGSITVLIDRFEGKRLNSPNDIVCRSDDSIWFTDPPFGISNDYEGDRSESELPANVYCVELFDRKSHGRGFGHKGAQWPCLQSRRKDPLHSRGARNPAAASCLRSHPRRKSTRQAPKSSPSRTMAARLTAFAATRTAICGADGAWAVRSSTALSYFLRRASGSAASLCLSVVRTSVSAGGAATGCSWRQAGQSIRCT